MNKFENFSKEEIEKIVSKSTSIRSFAANIGYKNVGGPTKTRLKKQLSTYNTSHFRKKREIVKNNCKQCGKETSNPKFCSTSCSASFNNKGIRRHGESKRRVCPSCGGSKCETSKVCSDCRVKSEYKGKITDWKAGILTGITGKYGVSVWLRKFLFRKFDHKCSKCGWCQVNAHTGRIPLEVDHIDGNYLNNKEENLDLLCPNCHSLTSTYKGANRGNGRKDRKGLKI